MADHDAVRIADRYADPGAGDLRSPLRFLLWLVAGQRRRVLRASLVGSAWMVGLAAPPYLLSKAIDEGLRARDDGALVGWVLALVAVCVANAGIGGLRHGTMTRIRTYSAYQVGLSTVRHSTRLGAALGRKSSSGEVVAIGLGDVQTISAALTVTGPGVGSVVAYAVVAGLLFTISPLLAVVVLAGVPVLAVTIGPMLHRAHGAMTPYREQNRVLINRLIDIVTGLRVLGGLGGKQAYLGRYREDSQALVGQGYRVGAASSWTGALGSGLPTLFLAAVTWIAARLAAEGSITVGQLIAVYGYVAMLVVPVSFFIEGAQQLTAATVAARRVIRFLALEPDHGGGVRELGPAEAGVLCDPVSGVEVPPGVFVALVGAVPADCTGVLERLARFTASDASWGGVRLDEVALPQIRSRILLAENDAALFAGTVREAVAGGREAREPDLGDAVRAAVATDIVDALSDGLDSALDSQARNLSGGQRQRLRMARALYAEPEVLLMTEPTSAVDAHTEAIMAARLREARRGLTTVVTTSSPLVLDKVDLVLHLVGGRVAASGKHQELWRSDPAYRAVVSRTTATRDQTTQGQTQGQTQDQEGTR
jgi:ABC-type bacteriocin/lantibiotic exporter with double-glycine peptidase domain